MTERAEMKKRYIPRDKSKDLSPRKSARPTETEKTKFLKLVNKGKKK